MSTFQNGIYIKAGLSPLRIANAFKMYASRRDRSKGPYLLVDIRAGKIPHIEVGGFVSVLGIEREGKLFISSSKYELKVRGRFLNLLDVGLHITAKYGSISRASYTVEGWFKNDLFHKLAQIVRNGLKKSAEIAKRFISAAQSKIRQTKAALMHTFDMPCGSYIENAKRPFDRAIIAKVQRLRRRLSRACPIRRCGSSKLQSNTFMSIVHKFNNITTEYSCFFAECIGCPSGWVCCKRVWGRCVCMQTSRMEWMLQKNERH